MLTTEQIEELNATYRLLSAPELRAQMGDNSEEDALIRAILEDGKQVELKGAKAPVDDGDDGDEAAPKAKAVPAEGDDDDDEGDDGATGFVDEHGNAVPDPNSPAAQEAAAAEAAKTTDPEPEPELAQVEVPALNLSFLNADHETALAALDTAKAEQFQALMDGDLTAAEYAKIEAQYMRDRDALREEKVEKAEWFTEVHGFQAKALQADGVDYFNDKEKIQSLDDWTKRLADKPENAGKPGSWFLEQAHRKVLAEFDLTPGTAPKTDEKAGKTVADGKKVANTQRRAPKLDDIPPTLGGLPVAAGNDAGDAGEFAHLDTLSGMAYEQALARMSPEQKSRYEAA